MADNVAKVKELMTSWQSGGQAFIDALADDATMESAMAGKTEGKEAIKAMVDGMRAKNPNMKSNPTNITASGPNTVEYDNELTMDDGTVRASHGVMTFGDDGKIKSIVSTAK